jgi:hypothetical protein
MASTEIRDWRRTLRYRHLLVRQMVQMKNRFLGLLMETGVSHNQQRPANVVFVFWHRTIVSRFSRSNGRILSRTSSWLESSSRK